MPELPPLGPEELAVARDEVRRRGHRIRARRWRALSAAGAVVAVVLAVAVLADDDDGAELRAAGSVTSTSPTPPPVLDMPASTSTQPSNETTTTQPPPPTSSTTVRPTTSVTPPAEPTDVQPEPEPTCTMATGEGGQVMADWQKHWITEPQPNDPVTVQVCIDDVTPAVGQEVSVTVTASDPDAVLEDHHCAVAALWGDVQYGDLCRDVLRVRMVPEPTPAEEPGHVSKSFTHTYEAAGSYTVKGRAMSGPSEDNFHPYWNYAAADIPIEVH